MRACLKLLLPGLDCGLGHWSQLHPIRKMTLSLESALLGPGTKARFLNRQMLLAFISKE